MSKMHRKDLDLEMAQHVLSSINTCLLLLVLGALDLSILDAHSF